MLSMAQLNPFDILNKTIGTSRLSMTHGIAYGPAPREKLDIYRPAKAKAALPVIVFFYGGSWQWGERGDYKFAAAVLAKRGFVVVVPDYRFYPEVKFPEFLMDCAAATSYVHKHIADYGGHPDEIFLMGHSAGAYNAVMLALNPDYLKAQGSGTDHLAGVIGLSGPYDFLPIRDPKIKAIFSPPADITATQPITFARGHAPPLFLAHGGTDITVLPRNTTALAARLRQQGGLVETKIYPRLGHAALLLATLPYLSWRAPVLADMLAFIAACRSGEYDTARAELEYDGLKPDQ